MSLDGYIDDASPNRLVLSGAADLDRVDEVRAGCDAILVGANTIRRDDPRLTVRSASRRAARQARGRPPTPVRVTLTARGELDPDARFFDGGHALVYCATSAVRAATGRLAAEVVDAGDPVDLAWVVADLGRRGIGRLLVEGGGGVHTQFLTADLADELQLAVAPVFVGDSRAPRFVGDGAFASRSAPRLVEARPVGDVALLRYALSDRCP
jgi:5-amino-6-(5-phosphoribosylamino)uracil reductase